MLITGLGRIELACPTPRTASGWPGGWLRDRLRAVAPGERYAVARDVVRGFAADLLGDLSKVDDDCGLDEMDMDSIMMIDLGDHLSHAMDEDLSAVVAVGYPSIRQLAGHLTTLAVRRATPRPRTFEDGD